MCDGGPAFGCVGFNPCLSVLRSGPKDLKNADKYTANGQKPGAIGNLTGNYIDIQAS